MEGISDSEAASYPNKGKTVRVASDPEGQQAAALNMYLWDKWPFITRTAGGVFHINLEKILMGHSH